MDDFPNLSIQKYQQIRHEVQSGDILLCSGNSLFSNMIQKATRSAWSHVAFILRLDVIDRIMVLESVESIGVRTVPLSNYVNDYNATGSGYPGRLLLARHSEFEEKNIIKLSKFATDLLGYPYGTEEILRIAARISMNSMGFKYKKPELIPNREFICSEYVHICFQSIGIDIEHDTQGFISPADFAKCEKIRALSFIETSQGKACAGLNSPSEKATRQFEFSDAIA